MQSSQLCYTMHKASDGSRCCALVAQFCNVHHHLHQRNHIVYDLRNCKPLLLLLLRCLAAFSSSSMHYYCQSSQYGDYRLLPLLLSLRLVLRRLVQLGCIQIPTDMHAANVSMQHNSTRRRNTNRCRREIALRYVHKLTHQAYIMFDT
jgi:hypothetical protein